MNILNAYIIKEILKGTSVALLVLLALVHLFTFSDELGDAGKGNYDIKAILTYLVLIAPRDCYELMPPATLIGSLVTLGALANQRELIAMQSAGFSLLKIIFAMLQAGFVVIVITLIIGEYIAPDSERNAQFIKARALNDDVTLLGEYGFWVRDTATIINIRKANRTHELTDINIYRLDAHNRINAVAHANEAIHKQGKWIISELAESKVTSERIVTERKKDATGQFNLDPDLLNVVVVRPDNLSILGLHKYIRFLKRSGQHNRKFELAFWHRILKPVTVVTMLLIAIPFLLGISRTRSTGQRVVLGILIGLGFRFFDRIFGHLGVVYDMNPVFAAAFPISLFLLTAIGLILKYR